MHAAGWLACCAGWAAPANAQFGPEGRSDLIASMKHANYFEIKADGYYELGRRRGELFGWFLRDTIERRKSIDQGDWQRYRDRARDYLEVSRRAFPQLIEELRGFADSSRVPFDDLWLLTVEDEVADSVAERCTTIVTNGGTLVGHNEDWEPDAAESICVLRKSIGDLNILELCYMSSIAGNAISVNSHGYVHAVNALLHSDGQVGVPKGLIARWLSETSAPDRDYRRLEDLRRASGFHHTLVSSKGDIWSIECSAARQSLERPKAPFVHTNHYLTRLARFDDSDSDDDWIGTRDRFRCATRLVRDSMTVEEMQVLLSDQSQGKTGGILNRRTIARMIVDVPQRKALVWLLREREKGWISYDISMPK